MRRTQLIQQNLIYNRKKKEAKMGMKIANIITSTSLFLALLACIAKAQSGTFDVTTYGAKAGGTTDISQALMSAWKAACASTTASKVLIPGGTFLCGQVTLEGPCKAPIKIELVGTLKAPADPSQFKDGDGWVTFNHVDLFTMSGGGVFDGQGATAWGQNDCAKTGKCSKLPTNIRFNFITNATIQDVTSLDSKLFHVNVLGGYNMTFTNFTITAPGNSLNTDGIHIGRSNGITIINSNIKTGDDCVSIGDGSVQITVEKVTCGPGHGISVGSLGKYENESPVSGIFVRNCTISNTDNGVRVKTWPASFAGAASDMHFEDIIMNNVGNPILIDQEYCPYNQCKAEVPSRIKISNVSFKNIRGTSSTKLAVKLACSKGIPCDQVVLSDINLTYNGTDGAAISQCSNVKPAISGKTSFPICAP